MSRYYTCAKCDTLTKEGEHCKACTPKCEPTDSFKGPSEGWASWTWQSDKGWVINDANYTADDDSGGD